MIPGTDTRKNGLDDYAQAHGLESIKSLIEQALTFEEWQSKIIDSQPKLSKRQVQIAKMERIFGSRTKLLVRGNQILIDGIPHNADYGYLEIEKKYGIGAGQEFFNQCLQWIASQHEYDPVKDWLEELHDRYGNSTIGMIDGISTRYLGTDQPLYDTYLKKVLLAAVDRVFNPGCKFETACVLQGGQGIGKSTFWRILGGQWFDDTMKDTSNDELMKLHCCWIQEWGEIDRVTGRKEANEIKQFLSVQNDKFRPPYGRQVVENPRRFIIVGSTNSGEFLQDTTGDRRFWIIPVPGKIDNFQLSQDVEKLWAGAYALWMNGGETTYLSPEEEALRDEFNAPYRNDDPWEEVIQKWLINRHEVKLSDIATLCLQFEHKQITRKEQHRIASILRQLGWVKRHTKNGKIWSKERSIRSQTDETRSKRVLHSDSYSTKEESLRSSKGNKVIDKNRKISKADRVLICNIHKAREAIGKLPWWNRAPDELLNEPWTVEQVGDQTCNLIYYSPDRSWTIPDLDISAVVYVMEVA